VLVELDRLAEVLQAVATEGANDDGVLEQLERRLREQDLAAVPGCCDPGRPVHVDAAVLPVDQERLTRVQSHPDAQVAPGEGILCRHGACERLARGGEGGVEAVALGADLDAFARADLLAKSVPVLRQRLAVPCRAELLEERGRPLDVGEQQGDRASRKLSHGRTE
jgi:hypothetical protein